MIWVHLHQVYSQAYMFMPVTKVSIDGQIYRKYGTKSWCWFMYLFMYVVHGCSVDVGFLNQGGF